MLQYSLSDAAKLAEASYTPANITAPRVIDRLQDGSDVDAVLLDGGTLLLPGSNSLNDYVKFNLRVFNVGTKRFRLDEQSTEKGASQTIWHQGFLTYAKHVFDWMGPRKPSYIIGHSLGAAAAQILCRTYLVPTIGFAAPRPKWVNGPVKDDGLCLSVCRTDDLVVGLAPGFSRMGRECVVRPGHPGGLFPHAMRHYRTLLTEFAGSGAIPARWPI